MAEAAGSLRIDLFVNLAQFRDGLSKAQGDLNRFAKASFDASKVLEKAGVRMSLAITAPLALFAVKAKDAARDFQDLQGIVDVSFGKMADSVNDWAVEAGDKFGRSTQEMLKSARDFNEFFEDFAPTDEAAAKLSTTFAELSKDLAEYLNVDDSEAFSKLQAGLAGSAKGLKKLGVDISDTAVKQKALELGIADTTDELSEQQKVLARAAIIYESLDKAQGEVIRGANDLDEIEKQAKAEFQELLVVIGNDLLPVFKSLTIGIRDVLKWFKELDADTRKTIYAIAGTAAAIGPVLIALSGLAKVASIGSIGLANLAKSGATAKTSFLGLTSGIVAYTAALYAAYNAGKLLGNVLADQIKKSDTALKIWYATPKILGGFGGSMEDAARAVDMLRKSEAAAADEAERIATGNNISARIAKYNEEVTNTDTGIEDLIRSFGKLEGEATDFGKENAAAIARIKSAIDPVGEALKAYNTDLEIARKAGIDLAEAQRALAIEMIDSVGGIDAVREHLDLLPPIFDEIVTAMEQSGIREEMAAFLEDQTKLLELPDVDLGQFDIPEDKTLEKQLKERERTIRSISDAIGDAVVGTKSWGDAFKEIVSQMLRTKVIQPFIDNLFSQAFGTVGSAGYQTGGFDFGKLIGSVGGFFGGGRADGGLMLPGMAYNVGERGREVVVPAVPSVVIPNDVLGGGGKSVTVVQNIQTTNLGDFRSSRRQLARDAKRAMETT